LRPLVFIQNGFTIGLSLVIGLVGVTTVQAQASGSRGGLERAAAEVEPLRSDTVKSHIVVEAKIEQRLQPTEIRMVLALVADGKTASDCQQQIQAQEEKLRLALKELDLGTDAVVTDFIAVLPRYQWKVKEGEQETVAVEESAGFRMQSNVHIKVASDQQALAVLQAAFQLELTDVIAFDYGSDQVDATKPQVRLAALEAVQEKAESLLMLFEKKPRLINVQTDTRVIYPRSKYVSFENSQSQSINSAAVYGRERMTRIEATKPQNTYYRGFQEQTDIQAQGLPMRPAISVVSTVRLYYEAPVTRVAGERDD
jgi:uncharacterized protein YggE